MQKFCCFPLNDPPDINVKVNCTSACCASDMTSNLDIPDNVNELQRNGKVYKKKQSCCCRKRRSHANKEKATQEMRNE